MIPETLSGFAFSLFQLLTVCEILTNSPKRQISHFGPGYTLYYSSANLFYI